MFSLFYYLELFYGCPYDDLHMFEFYMFTPNGNLHNARSNDFLDRCLSIYVLYANVCMLYANLFSPKNMHISEFML